jgi:hypothetical protein
LHRHEEDQEAIVRVKPLLWMTVLAAATTGLALPAAADVTLLSRYTLVSGDTLSRPSYFTSRRMRTTAPDGKEFMYDGKTKTLTIINHAKRIYWSGPLAQADSLADSILTVSRRELAKIAAADQAAWMAKVQAFNDSIRIVNTGNTHKIAGYPASLWTVSAGSYMQNERWVARSLAVAKFEPEVEKAVMASIMDPVGRQLMKLLMGARSSDGLVLASKTSYHTPTQSGNFSFETYQVVSTPIPDTAWEIPRDYKPIQL